MQIPFPRRDRRRRILEIFPNQDRNPAMNSMKATPENSNNQRESNALPGIVRRSFIKRTTATAPFTVLALNQFRSEAKAGETGDSSSGKDLKLTVSPSILGCGAGQKITATAEVTSKSPPAVTLTCPDGTFTGKGKVSHEYTVKDSDCGTLVPFSAAGAGKSETKKVPVIKITFDLPTTPHKIGISVGKHDCTQSFTATITPPEFVANAKVSHGPNLALKNGTKDSKTGIITFDAVGTAKSAAKGDTYISITVGPSKVTRSISVVIPARIPNTHIKSQTYAVVPKKQALNKTTVPALWNFPAAGQPPDFVEGATLCGTTISVPVVDQFDESLEHLYDGADITEQPLGDPDKYAINVTLNGSQYPDWIGRVEESAVVGKPDSTAIKIFLETPPSPPEAGAVQQNLAVRVDGFPLHPPVARILTWTPPQTLVLDWP